MRINEMSGQLRTSVFSLLAPLLFSLAAATAKEADPPPGEGNAPPPSDVVIVLGASGTPEYGEAFAEWADRWERICQRSNHQCVRIGGDDGGADGAGQIQATLRELAAAPNRQPLWIVLIGHGTWDGKTANFNLVGPDVSAKQLDDWLQGFQRPVIMINCGSSSGPFIDRLSGPNRVIVTATKSGSEQNYARFGRFFSAAIASPQADVDHDDAVSVREAFLKASSDVDRFYKERGRLVTEHALLDDNADRKGSDDSLVAGKTSAKEASQVDGEFADRLTLPTPGNTLRLSDNQLQQRNRLEQQLEQLRQQSTNADAEQLRKAALPVLMELAKLYAEAEQQSD